MSSNRSTRAPRWLLGFALMSLGAACSGSGSRSGGADEAVLLSVSFPDGVSEVDSIESPLDAPLVQPVVFTFSAAPPADQVDARSMPVRGDGGFVVPGDYRVVDVRVIFTPQLPLNEVVIDAAGRVDTGGTGLQPGANYSVRLSPMSGPAFLVGVDAALRARHPDPVDPEGVLVSFRTTTEPARFFQGLPRRAPQLLRATPSDGSSNVGPRLFTDPSRVFPASASITLTFDGPVHPSALHLDACRLIDVDERGGLELGRDVFVRRNTWDGAEVELVPHGILAFGHRHAVEYGEPVVALSAEARTPPRSSIAATWTTSLAPSGEVSDALVETFDDTTREDDAVGEGLVPAAWQDGVAEAGFGFRGDGRLGRFIPTKRPGAEGPTLVLLDTSRQVFPLLDGSTPDAPSGLEVIGGVFSFTTIDIPDGVLVEAIGANPLILTATESVRIAGSIVVAGKDGTHENAFDSAVTSVPGGPPGAGGGRGGEGQPIVYLGDIPSQTTLISPTHGGQGWGPLTRERLGGFGGQCGILDRADDDGRYGTDHEINCLENVNSHNNGYKPPGGGGGTFLERGTRAENNGTGNVLADGLGGFIVRSKEELGRKFNDLERGKPGLKVFVDEDDTNDWFGSRGELREVHGGQGGGAGASALDAYFCGAWCLLDDDPDNDVLCVAEFGNPPLWADSVGDARGGAGGGGGGALVIESLGAISLTSNAVLDAHGGAGGGGEQVSCGNWSGCGAGGSGGAIVLRCVGRLFVEDNVRLDVSGGEGALAAESTNQGRCDRAERAEGTAGDGGHGIVQLQVPAGFVADVDPGALITPGAWVDPDNTLNPAEFGPRSRALSTWYDCGRMIARVPLGQRPLFHVRGLDAGGFVRTDDDGQVLDARDLECDYLGQLDPLRPGHYVDGQEPREDYVPPNASVQVEFQGGSAIVEGAKEVDPNSLTPWAPHPSIADGLQFLRYRITFDLTADGTSELLPSTPRPAVQSIRLPATY